MAVSCTDQHGIGLMVPCVPRTWVIRDVGGGISRHSGFKVCPRSVWYARTLKAEVAQLRDILSRISKWWEAGDTFGLATVVRTYRSAPRDPGAALAVSAEGEVIGSVSGGCVEGAVYELSIDVSQTGSPVLQTYGVSDDDAFAVGLTCGGILDIFVEPVNQARFPELGDIAAAVERGEPVAVATVTGGPGQLGARRVIWGRPASDHAASDHTGP